MLMRFLTPIGIAPLRLAATAHDGRPFGGKIDKAPRSPVARIIIACLIPGILILLGMAMFFRIHGRGPLEEVANPTTPRDAFGIGWFFTLTPPDGQRLRIGPFDSLGACEATRQTIENGLRGTARLPCV
jgi:hypothetical protein